MLTHLLNTIFWAKNLHGSTEDSAPSKCLFISTVYSKH